MKTVGIIAEYNPFHKGHAYQLQKAKELTGADYVVVVMSGCFVQRGLPALVDKFVRAEMALRCGADLVLELPVFYATGSAETFAQGAVSLLTSLGCVDALCFGSESGDLPALSSFARLFEEEPEEYKGLLKAFLKRGLSFPAARSRAAEEYFHYTDHVCPCSPWDADCGYESAILSQPNNILGVEYCRALLRQKSPIKPVTLPRKSTGYHDLSLEQDLASASAIRAGILKEGLSQKVRKQLPLESWLPLEKALATAFPLTLDDFSSILFYRLLSLSKEELAEFMDVSEDLAFRMANHRFLFTKASSFADLLKTKQLTHTRITRALCHILLDLKQRDFEKLKKAGYPSSLRVLGLRKSASPLLSSIKERSASPLLVKAADAPHLLAPLELSLLEKDVFAAHVYEAARAGQRGVSPLHEYTRSPLVLP